MYLSASFGLALIDGKIRTRKYLSERPLKAFSDARLSAIIRLTIRRLAKGKLRLRGKTLYPPREGEVYDHHRTT